jgi:hypothetical protein
LTRTEQLDVLASRRLCTIGIPDYLEAQMTALDAFATLMNAKEIPVDANVLPDTDTISAALDRIDTWFWALDPAVREGYDEATGEEALCRMLADPEFDVASDISDLLDAFDRSAGQTLSMMVAAARACLAQALKEQGVG